MSRYMELWDCDDMDLIRGHATKAEVERELAFYGIDLDGRAIRHTYARTIPTPHGEYDSELRLSRRGRGAFPVTVVSAGDGDGRAE